MLGREFPNASGSDRTSIMFSASDEARSLYGVLGILEMQISACLELSQSRPVKASGTTRFSLIFSVTSTTPWL